MARYQRMAPHLRGQIQLLLEGQGATDIDALYGVLELEKEGLDKRVLAQNLRHMATEGLVRRDGNMVVWTGKASKNGKVTEYREDAYAPQHIRNRTVEAPPSIRHPRKIELPEFQQGRQGHLVTVEAAADEYPNVVQLQFQIGEHWFNQPMPETGHVRICIGDRMPRWARHQEKNYGISAIRFVYEDGSFDVREGVNPKEPVVVVVVS